MSELIEVIEVNRSACQAQISYFCRYLCCPDCKSSLSFQFISSGVGGENGILECPTCSNLYPVKDGIPVLLRTGTRNTRFETDLFQSLKLDCKDEILLEKVDIEICKLEKIRFSGSWEWDDVEFWDKNYQQNWQKLCSGDPSFYEKLLPERVLQRKKEMGILARDDSFPENLIVEVGAGTATYTKSLLEKHEKHDYIAVDMSFYGLKIRRQLMGRRNALYVLASIDNLPIKECSVGGMILIGILHHSEHKEHTLPSLMKLIANDGLIYLDEVLYRPSFLRHADKVRGDNISLHEEYVYYEPLHTVIQQQGKIVYQALFNTPFYNFAIKKMIGFVTASDASYRFIRLLDTLCRKTLGLILKSFKAGEVTIIWKKASSTK